MKSFAAFGSLVAEAAKSAACVLNMAVDDIAGIVLGASVQATDGLLRMMGIGSFWDWSNSSALARGWLVA